MVNKFPRGVVKDFHNRYNISKTKFYNNIPCWEWKTKPENNGYCRCIVDGVRMAVHRYSYELYNGKISSKLVVDHLCRNTICVNPQHLEAVTSKENTIRGIGPAAKNAQKTHCKHGHEFTVNNTYIYYEKGAKKRQCRTCFMERARAKRGYKGNLPNKLKKYCKRGHELTANNIYVRKDKIRHCKPCAIKRASEQRERNKRD